MDLGIAGKNAIVCAASKGLGKGCAMALAKEGVNITITARTAETLEQTGTELRQLGAGKITTVASDITTSEGRAKVLAACPNPDILINNAGGPPAGDWRSFSRDDWIKAIDANMLTPIEMMKATIDGMIERKFGRIVNITSAAVKAPIEILALSNGARTGLTGFVAGLSRSVAKHNVIINNLLPGLFATDTMISRISAGAKIAGKPYEEMEAERMKPIAAGRFGNIEEFGIAAAFLCSAHVGYVVGQNFLIDGGAYGGTF